MRGSLALLLAEPSQSSDKGRRFGQLGKRWEGGFDPHSRGRRRILYGDSTPPGTPLLEESEAPGVRAEPSLRAVRAEQ